MGNRHWQLAIGNRQLTIARQCITWAVGTSHNSYDLTTHVSRLHSQYEELMNRTRVIAIFDIGKTNKKLFLFDEEYKIILEESVQLEETTDEDGYSCEDIIALTKWVKDSLTKLTTLKNFEIAAISFSAYGASFVHVDDKGNPVAPLYNYLKPYPGRIKAKIL